MSSHRARNRLSSRLAPRPLPPERDALLASALSKDPDARAAARTFAAAIGAVAAA